MQQKRRTKFRQDMELKRKRRKLRALNPPHRRSLNPHTQLFLDNRKRERERYRDG